jgi:YesN/AraC family two-component response regulator
MQRICDLMEQQQLFKDSNLKLSDVADALGTNRTYISTCIRNYNGSSFSLFVNAYRVEYAQQLLRSNADIKLSEVWSSSGFSSESSFFRAFKTITGTTPKDWIAEG